MARILQLVFVVPIAVDYKDHDVTAHRSKTMKTMIKV
jgi:hypothetical protein